MSEESRTLGRPRNATGSLRMNAFFLTLVCATTLATSALAQKPSHNESETGGQRGKRESKVDCHQGMLELLEQIRGLA